MAKRRMVEPREAAELVAAWQASGESVRDWSRARGIDGRSLRHWVERLAPAPVLRLVEVTPAKTATSNGICLRLQGVAITVQDGFSEETLVRVLRVVRAC